MTDNRNHMIPELEGLRGILALWVLVGHWATSIPLDFRPLARDLWNVQAVDVFIILSGFVITLLLVKRQTSYREYIVRRVLRILPAFLAVFFVSVLTLPYIQTVIANGAGEMREARLEIINDTYTHYWENFWLHLGMLHGLAPTAMLPQANFSFVGQAWSISLEWQFYLIAPVFMYLFATRRIISWLIAGVLCVLLATPGHYFGPAYIGNKLHLFGIGATSYMLWAYVISNGTIKRIWPIRFIAMGAVLLVVGLFRTGGLGIAVWVLAMHAIMANRYAPNSLEASLSKLLCQKPCQFLGYISYTLYVSHFLVMIGVMWVLQQTSVPGTAFSALLLAGTCTGSLAMAYMLTKFVERPFMELGKRGRAKSAPTAL